MSFIPAERELELAQWTHALSMIGISEMLVRAQGEAVEEWASTPRWRIFRRRRLDREWKMMLRLFFVAHDYAQQQSEHP